MIRKLAAELIGTFSLVFAGTGAVVIDARGDDSISSLGIGLTFGVIIMVMIFAIGHISGAHMNPAITLGLAVGRHFPIQSVLPYWAAQVAGAILASLTLRGLFGKTADLGATLPGGTNAQALVLEMTLMAIIVFVVTSVATDSRAIGQSAAIAIGSVIGMSVLIAGPISGGSVNPARSLAPALVSNTWTDQWIYLTAPFIGAAIGAAFYMFVRGDDGVANPS